MKFNDYELIYLYYEGNEQILSLLIKKYTPLIKSMINKFNVNKLDMEDYLQEGLMVLYKCILSYNEDKGLFYYFFRVSLKRAFISLVSRNTSISYVLLNDFDNLTLKENITKSEIVDLKDFQELLDIKSMSIKEYAKKNNISVKKVYNYINKLKNKIKKYKL